MNAITQSPTTWLDVARRLAGLIDGEDLVPSFVLKAQAGWFGLSITVSGSGHEAKVRAWLEDIFPSRIHADPLRIELEGPPHISMLPIEIEISTDEHAAFRQSFGIVDGVIDFCKPIPLAASLRSLPVVAALSVKGGTGRNPPNLSAIW